MSQRLEALRLANVVRLEAARVKGEIAALGRIAGARRVAEMLRDPTNAIGALRMEALLLVIHKAGPWVVGAILTDARIPHGARLRRVREFTPRQRDVIAGLLERWADGQLVVRRTA